MSDAAASVRAARERLLGAGRLLRERPRSDVVRSLGALLETLRDPGSSPRRALARELPAATGFSLPVVEAGLSLALEPWTAKALEQLVADACGAERAPRRMANGFDTTAVILGGALPTPTISSLLFPLAVGSPVLAKPSQHDAVTAQGLARALADLDPGLGACLEIVRFERSDAAALEAFLASPCVVATGSDETMAALSARVLPPRRFVGHGHRLSLAVVGPHALTGQDLDAAARGLALDVALWDQLGCLSPVSVHVIAGAARGDAAAAFASALASALGELSKTLPRGHVPRAAAASISHERAAAEMRAAAGRPVAIHEGGDFVVVREADATPRPAPLHRFVRVHPVASLDDALAALAPLGPHLAGVALAGLGDGATEAAEALVALGASRVCAPGRLQQPPLDWPHDGVEPLSSLLRYGEIE